MGSSFRSPGALAWLLGIAALAVAAAWGAPKGPAAARRRAVLLDTRVAVGSEGALLAFRLDRPGAVEIRVDLPEGDATHLVVGPPGPVAPPAGGAYRPDPATSERIEIRGAMRVPIARNLQVVGNYALHVEPYPTAAEDAARTARVLVVAP